MARHLVLRVAWFAVLATISACAIFPLASPSVAASQPAADSEDAAEQLAMRYAPVVRLSEQAEPCGGGEPYRPVDVDALLGNSGVAFRGPWRARDLVKVAPTSQDLRRGYLGYHLDFPGDALSPGCDYEKWARHITKGFPPVTYAHVVTERDRPGTVALQYWFFYVFNDWNNLHEGDWEMIQLIFDAVDAADALGTSPSQVGYSQHSSAERTEWGSEEMELVDGTHPVVYPAEGSHANFFSPALFLGRDSRAGVGCDDTTAPHHEIRPQVAFVPTRSSEYLQDYPWLAFEGRWGEQRSGFYNGPTGPNMKERWTEPIQWSENRWRDSSAVVPLGSTLGPDAAAFFCGSIESGSLLVVWLVRHPVIVAIALLALVGLVLALAARTDWSPADPRPVQVRRAWGQIVATSWTVYRRHPVHFLGIGAIFLPVMAFAAGLQWLLFELAGVDTLSPAGNPDPVVAVAAFVAGSVLSLAGYFWVLAAVAASVAGLDRGETFRLSATYRSVHERARPLAGTAVVLVTVVTALAVPVVAIPLAVAFAVRRGFAVQSVMLENKDMRAALGRSRDLVRGHFWRVALIASLLVGTGLLLGPLTGVALLLASNASPTMVNLVSAVIYTVAIPYVALGLTYLFGDLQARQQVATTRDDTPRGTDDLSAATTPPV